MSCIQILFAHRDKLLLYTNIIPLPIPLENRFPTRTECQRGSDKIFFCTNWTNGISPGHHLLRGRSALVRSIRLWADSAISKQTFISILMITDHNRIDDRACDYDIPSLCRNRNDPSSRLYLLSFSELLASNLHARIRHSRGLAALGLVLVLDFPFGLKEGSKVNIYKKKAIHLYCTPHITDTENG